MNNNLDFTGSEFDSESLDFRNVLLAQSQRLPVDDNQSDTLACASIALDGEMIAANGD